MLLSVAFDVGPLAGRRTGIGAGVAALRDALVADGRVELSPYLLSFRARPEPGVTRLPLPAAVAHRVWAHTDVPRVDRWLGAAQVVHGTNYVVPPTRGAARLVSVYDCWFLHHPDRAHPDVVRAGRVLERSVRHGAVVHASSRATADAVRSLWPEADVRVVLLGAMPLPDAPDAAPIAELDGRDFVLAVGTLERRKNLPRLVAAFGELASVHPELRLVLAGGDGDDRPAIDAAIDALGADLARRVMFTGYVDEPVRSWLLHHARVLAYPSLDEGFGFPLLDAMGAGVPIVASRAGSIPEVAGEAALLAPADDVAALATALERALVDTAERDRLIAAGRVRRAQLTWSATADAFVQLYHELSGGRS
ncbi:MAG: glycosyltransferase family 1 protein [Acidimicrobiales bacterium]